MLAIMYNVYKQSTHTYTNASLLSIKLGFYVCTSCVLRCVYVQLVAGRNDKCKFRNKIFLCCDFVIIIYKKVSTNIMLNLNVLFF